LIRKAPKDLQIVLGLLEGQEVAILLVPPEEAGDLLPEVAGDLLPEVAGDLLPEVAVRHDLTEVRKKGRNGRSKKSEKRVIKSVIDRSRVKEKNALKFYKIDEV
jgi:hypothetical protein